MGRWVKEVFLKKLSWTWAMRGEQDLDLAQWMGRAFSSLSQAEPEKPKGPPACSSVWLP